MELIVETPEGAAAVQIELGADLGSRTLADLRTALGLAVGAHDHQVSLADVGLHRAMTLRADPALPTAGPHLAAGWRPDHVGRFAVVRPPARPRPRPAELEHPEPPPPPEQPPPIPYSTVIPMLMVSGLMAVLWSPMFAILSGASAMIPLARALGPRVMQPRRRRGHDEALEQHRREMQELLDRHAGEVADWVSRRVNSPGELDRLVESAVVRPWTRRLAADEPLAIGVGRGSLEIEHPQGCPALDDVPLVLDVDHGMAITGGRLDVLAIARWVGVDVAFRHGPADLDVAVLTTGDRLVDWEWIRWIPGLRAVAVDLEVDAVSRSIIDDDRTAHLVFVDGVSPSGSGPFARLLGGQSACARVIWLGEEDSIPAVCEVAVEATADGFVRAAGERARGWAWRLGADEAEQLAQFLAPFTDPEVDERSIDLPSTVPLARICPDGGATDDGVADAAIEASWTSASPRRLLVPLGVGASGEVEIDLVADGPHALVAGTTGAGKSELLRSMVIGAATRQSPAHLSFVLIDFKGGGAFDAVADLPHVSAVVTDLEPGQAMRALRSLRAELHGRERFLRHHRVSDVSDLPNELEGPPRLVVMVDEFAALADDVPDFLDGLVDVARRGRSLGVHLVLATQRPAGVVTNDIRANTNLRICLRVRDAADSVDVIDSVDAAALPAIPGRAIMTVGGEHQRLVQVAHTTGASSMTWHPFELGADRHAILGDTSWPRRVIETIVRRHPQRTAAPWLPSLPEALDAERMWGIGNVHGDRLAGPPPIGFLDDPDRRVQTPIVWAPTDGGALVAAADPGRVLASLTTVVASVVLDRPDVEFLALDGGGNGMERLAVLGSVADVISHRDEDRLVRAIVRLERRRRGGSPADPPLVVVINRFGTINDALTDALGPDAQQRLVRLFADGSIVPLIGVTSDRELPSRVLATMRRRFIHRLADAGAGLVFDVHPSVMPPGGAAVFDVEARLSGVIADLSDDGLARVAAWSVPKVRPEPVKTLTERMSAEDLDRSCAGDGGPNVPIAFDEDLDPVAVTLSPDRPFIILGRPGSGRSTALATLRWQGADQPLGFVLDMIDDADMVPETEMVERLAANRAAGRVSVIASTPTIARRFGSWLTPLLGDATVLLLNPARADGEILRVDVPDLSHRSPGRGALVDRGRVRVVQVAVTESTG